MRIDARLYAIRALNRAYNMILGLNAFSTHLEIERKLSEIWILKISFNNLRLLKKKSKQKLLIDVLIKMLKCIPSLFIKYASPINHKNTLHISFTSGHSKCGALRQLTLTLPRRTRSEIKTKTPEEWERNTETRDVNERQTKATLCMWVWQLCLLAAWHKQMATMCHSHAISNNPESNRRIPNTLNRIVSKDSHKNIKSFWLLYQAIFFNTLK